MDNLASATTTTMVISMDLTQFIFMDRILRIIVQVLLLPLRLVAGIAMLIHVARMLHDHKKIGLDVLLTQEELDLDLMYPKHNETSPQQTEATIDNIWDVRIIRTGFEDLDEHLVEAYHNY